ncbi:efflux RND transporter periplasmic adaptor subunit [Stieleria varia]|uniref:HlyD family secretion protein n=1 Tax=Stieleria varia TaxID=2528005 RepID=A0A5C6B7A7_9BACT|nr:efflux RND transporter periplasmic adaptor subunit [Stieleria varia]TWU08135.1 HlyD family secretion protein [Stieleria varia]
MSVRLDEQTRDLESSRIRLSEDLKFLPRIRGQEFVCVIESPAKGTFYRVGHSEYVLISLLDGRLTVAQAITLASRQLGPKALTRAQGLQVVQWLLDSGLGDRMGESAGSSFAGKPEGNAGADALQYLNPFWTKIPLGSPDAFFQFATRGLGWLFSPVATLLGVLMIASAIICLGIHWDRFVSSSATILSPMNWLWLGLAWLGLKIIHEIGHGIACRYHGGDVRETGVILILFAPMAYVDVTSCWRFSSRWQRIHVAAAGMYIELVVAAISVFWWSNTESVVASHLLYNVIVMASVSTFLFNANPLMRFDGYYILSDFLQIPNLASEGANYLKGQTARMFFGTAAAPPRDAGFGGLCIRLYGVAALIWKLLICVSLTATASVLFSGAGIVLAMVGVTLWFGKPLFQGVAAVWSRFHESRVSCFRAVGVANVIVAFSAIVLLYVPWPGNVTAPGIVDYADRCVVRTRSSGFVEQILVENGQAVQQGQVLMRLQNDELRLKQYELESELEQGRVRLRIARDDQDFGAVQIAQSNLQAVQERLNEVRQQTESLTIQSPVAGTIISRALEDSLGTYYQEGAEILVIGSEQDKELVVSIDQQDMQLFSATIDDQANIRLAGNRYTGTLRSVDPRASTQIPHPAMSVAVGGMLAVTVGRNEDDESQMLTEPRFRATIGLSSDVCTNVGAGQQGYAILGAQQMSIGSFLWTRAMRWLERLLTPTLRG